MDLPAPLRLFNPDVANRIAELSVQPAAGSKDAYVLRQVLAPRTSAYGQVTNLGPFPASEINDRFDQARQALLDQGYLPPGWHAMLTDLGCSDPALRARAALRFGWRRCRDAVPWLTQLLETSAEGDICSALDALGMIGDPSAAPDVRPFADRKLLSRRRSAVEALRNFGDEPGVTAGRQRSFEQMPPPARTALQNADADAASLAEAVRGLDLQHRGVSVDYLYELGTPASVEAARELLRELPFDRAFVWRYVKSVFKRSMLRHDAATFGQLAHDVESQGRGNNGTMASVKSGYDGVQRSVRIFGKKTQTFMRGLSWRYLRNLARWRPELYAPAAAEALIRYTPEDAENPSGLYGTFAGSYLLNRVLYSGGDRLVLNARTLRWRYRDAKSSAPPFDTREEAFPSLWDEQPRAYLRVLGFAQLPEAHPFAVRALGERHPEVLHNAPVGELIPLLGAPYDGTVALGLAELDRRFDPENPDFELLDSLLKDARPTVLPTAHRWLRQTVGRWSRDPARVLAWLTSADGPTRVLVADLLVAGFDAKPSVRAVLADGILELLKKPEPTPGAYESLARVAGDLLADELNRRLSLRDLMGLIATGSTAAQAVGGRLLAHRPEAMQELGVEYVSTLAQHSVAAVRSAAHGLLRSAPEALRADPSVLYVLVESEWDDTRTLAFELLRSVVDWERAGLDGLTGLLDSNRTDVQDFGIELVRKHLPSLPVADLVDRLVEHPHPNVRRFTVGLVAEELPARMVDLPRLDGFFRTAVLDLWPSRDVKRRVLDFVAGRGLQDATQAAVAAEFLGAVVRSQNRADFERALEALVRIRMKFPEVDNAVTLREQGAPA